MAHTDDELHQCAVKAYDGSIAKYHPFLVRKVVHGALYFLPKKQKFYDQMGENVKKEREIKRKQLEKEEKRRSSRSGSLSHDQKQQVDASQTTTDHKETTTEHKDSIIEKKEAPVENEEVSGTQHADQSSPSEFADLRLTNEDIQSKEKSEVTTPPGEIPEMTSEEVIFKLGSYLASVHRFLDHGYVARNMQDIPVL